MKDVAVLGVGMHRFGMWAEKSNADMAREAGLAALRDAGLSFRDVQAAYAGYIFAPVMSAVRTMKEFGLTGIPVQHVENASATGSAAFREACFAVESGRHDVVMVLGFDKMSEMIQRSGAGTDPAYLEDSILPAAFFAMWATRRIHERGTKPEHLAAIAAKNFNNGALNPMSQRQPDQPVTVEKVLASRMVAWPLTAMMSCPIGDGAACAIVGRPEMARKLRAGRPVVRVLASELQTERYERGHLFVGPVVGPARMSVDTSRAAYEQAGLGPADMDLVQGGGGGDRARRLRAGWAGAGVDRRRAHRARAPGRADGACADLGDGAATARRGRKAAGEGRARGALPHDGRRERVRDPHPGAGVTSHFGCGAMSPREGISVQDAHGPSA